MCIHNLEKATRTFQELAPNFSLPSSEIEAPLALLSVLALPLPALRIAPNIPLHNRNPVPYTYLNGDFFLSHGQPDNSFLNWNRQMCS